MPGGDILLDLPWLFSKAAVWRLGPATHVAVTARLVTVMFAFGVHQRRNGQVAAAVLGGLFVADFILSAWASRQPRRAPMARLAPTRQLAANRR